RDIEAHMRDIYGIDVSAELVSKITDKVMPLVTEWQCR
ncbi:Transposase, Mutator family, partial [Acididesulfobacillus acetoxydans]